jgi:hypothetical protein
MNGEGNPGRPIVERDEMKKFLFALGKIAAVSMLSALVTLATVSYTRGGLDETLRADHEMIKDINKKLDDLPVYRDDHRKVESNQRDIIEIQKFVSAQAEVNKSIDKAIIQLTRITEKNASGIEKNSQRTIKR